MEKLTKQVGLVDWNKKWSALNQALAEIESVGRDLKRARDINSESVPNWLMVTLVEIENQLSNTLDSIVDFIDKGANRG